MTGRFVFAAHVSEIRAHVVPKYAALRPNGSFIEGTTAIQNESGELVTTTIRWFEYNNGEITISTAFCP